MDILHRRYSLTMVSAPLTLKFIFSLPRTTRLDELYLFVNESLQIEDKEIHGSEAPIEIIKAQKMRSQSDRRRRRRGRRHAVMSSSSCVSVTRDQLHSEQWARILLGGS